MIFLVVNLMVNDTALLCATCMLILRLRFGVFSGGEGGGGDGGLLVEFYGILHNDITY